MRYTLIGLWIGIVSITSSYMAGYWVNKNNLSEFGVNTAQVGMDFEQTNEINVPMISDGMLKGYIVAQFVYTIDGRTLETLAVPPGPYVTDEAFRAIFNDLTIDFDNLKHYDIDGLRDTIKANVNARMKAELVHDILVEKFSYYPKKMSKVAKR